MFHLFLYTDGSFQRKIGTLKDCPDIEFHREDIPAYLLATGDGLSKELIESKLTALLSTVLSTQTEVSAESIENGAWTWKILVGSEGWYMLWS